MRRLVLAALLLVLAGCKDEPAPRPVFSWESDRDAADSVWHSKLPIKNDCQPNTICFVGGDSTAESLRVSHSGQRIDLYAPDWRCDPAKPGQRVTCRRGLYRQAVERQRKIRALTDRSNPADYHEVAAQLRLACAVLQEHHLAVTEEQ